MENDVVDIGRLLMMIEKEFGVRYVEEGSMTNDQKDRMTRYIFQNEEVLQQLRQSRSERDPALSNYSSHEQDFEKLVDEMNNDR